MTPNTRELTARESQISDWFRDALLLPIKRVVLTRDEGGAMAFWGEMDASDWPGARSKTISVVLQLKAGEEDNDKLVSMKLRVLQKTLMRALKKCAGAVN